MSTSSNGLCESALGNSKRSFRSSLDYAQVEGGTLPGLPIRRGRAQVVKQPPAAVSAARVLARRRGQQLLSQGCDIDDAPLLDDPTGTLFTRGVRPSWPRRCLIHTLETLVIAQTAVALAISARLACDAGLVASRQSAESAASEPRKSGAVRSVR